MRYARADYILRFDSKDQAEQFAMANGFARTDKNGKVYPLLATSQYSLFVVGQYFKPPTIEGDPYVGDGKWWVLFRDLAGLELPAGAENFIIWASWQTDEIPDPEDPSKTITVKRPRPTDAPQIKWA